MEQRILQELADHQLMPAADGTLRDIQYEDLGRLTYLNAVIKVLLRPSCTCAWPDASLASDHLCSYAEHHNWPAPLTLSAAYSAFHVTQS